ncbi:DedA family protein [Segniliparus rotundus]|nr:DedA family protein [Segniliparus rotundus]
MVGHIIHMIVATLQGMPPWALLVMAFLLPALEASVFLGVVVPGEIVLLLAAIGASKGQLPLWAVIVAGVLGAVIGDFVGFEVGKRWGHSLLEKLPKRIVKPDHIDRAKAALRRRGALTVFFGRWAAALRAFVPGLAGMSGMRLRVYAPANAAGGFVWAVAVVLLGFTIGQHVEKYLSQVSNIVTVLVAALLLYFLVKEIIRARAKRATATSASKEE